MITLDYERGWEGGKNCPNFDNTYYLSDPLLSLLAMNRFCQKRENKDKLVV